MSALTPPRLYPLFCFSKRVGSLISLAIQGTAKIRTGSVFHSIYVDALPPLFIHRDSLRQPHHEAGG